MTESTPTGLCECGCGQPTTIPDKTNRKLGRVKGQPMRFIRGHRQDYAHRGPLKHGLSAHPLYTTWRNMISRCENPADPSYHNWGGRGIQVCEHWHDIRVFIIWMEENLGLRPEGMTLDRIDNDRGYEPGNVRWTTPAVQRANQRRLGRMINGRTQDERKAITAQLRQQGLTQQAIGRVLGISQASVWRYLKGGD
jgi:hypothetical protein